MIRKPVYCRRTSCSCHRLSVITFLTKALPPLIWFIIINQTTKETRLVYWYRFHFMILKFLIDKFVVFFLNKPPVGCLWMKQDSCLWFVHEFNGSSKCLLLNISPPIDGIRFVFVPCVRHKTVTYLQLQHFKRYA